ncbi:nucleotidyl transferase AbiEii/AbiGii toxin family protein [Nocardia nova]|uniref:nucleotidyl transferase AbiEii/AbiGii toxin family protein n=1 Tax=Nocardia nova TaxID=37330 RepID=UPI0033C86F3D
MPPRLREHPDDLAALIGAAADGLALDQEYVEKDFWACEVLRACAMPTEVTGPGGSTGKLRVIFKGGTSLSRVFGLIERFSEDIDLLVQFPDVGAGAGTKDAVFKRVIATAATHLGLPEDKVVAAGSTKGVKRNARFHYPTRRPASVTAAISSGVLLEMGTRGGVFPTQVHEIRALIGDFAIREFGDSPDTWAEFMPFAVEVLAPERTLIEKLSALHSGAARAPAEDALATLQRNARHLYDIHCLLSDPSIVDALERLGPAGVAQLCADVDEHSAAAGFSFTPRPPGGFGASPLLAGDNPGADALRIGYRSAMSLVYGTQPTMEQCLDSIRARADLL